MASLRDADPRQLAALVAVADTGTFGRAALTLGFTQSAISQQIAQLERAAGTSLFDRPKGPRPATLTPVGEAVVDYARTTLDRIDRMDQRLDLMRRGLAGRLEVGTFQSASAEMLPNIISRMRSEVPDVDVRLEETDDVDVLVEHVLDGSIDFAIITELDIDPHTQAVLDIHVLGLDPFVVVAPIDEAVTTATVEMLRDQPLIGQPHTDWVQRVIDRRLIDAGITPEYAFRFQNNSAVQSMVRLNMGWSVMPALAVDLDDDEITIIELEPPLPSRRVEIVARKDRSLPPGADRFVQIALDVGAKLLDQA